MLVDKTFYDEKFASLNNYLSFYPQGLKKLRESFYISRGDVLFLGNMKVRLRIDQHRRLDLDLKIIFFS
jgi:hypothetical protein